MSLSVTSVEAFFMTGMLESWADPGNKPVIKSAIVGQHFYEYKDKSLKFAMRISSPARNTHKCDGSISVSENSRSLWCMHFSGYCRPDAIPFLQFFHRVMLSNKQFGFGPTRTNLSEGDYRYGCTPKPNSSFLSFEGSESIRLHETVITRFSYHGRFMATGFLSTEEILMTA